MGWMIEALAVAGLIVQVWLSERIEHAAASLLRETVAVRRLVLVDPEAAVARLCSDRPQAGQSWCRLRVSVREEGGWRSVCEVEEPVVRGIDRYYAVEGRCDFPFPFGATHTLRLREIVRR